MSAPIQIGVDQNDKPVTIDIEELLATRLLVQGNSGSGKSHLLRRILEESASIVQQVVIDPEGDFVTLADLFGHIVVDGAAYSAATAFFLPISPWPHTRSSTPASCSSFSAAMFGLSTPLCRAL